MSNQQLQDICELIVDCEHKTAPIQDEGYPSIRTPNIGRGKLILDGVNRVSDETYKRWTQRAIPQYEDLVLAREAPIGNVAIIPRWPKVCLGQRTVLIRPDRSQVVSQYLCYLLLGDELQGRIHSYSNGATVHHLNMKDIRELCLPPLPAKTTQAKIAAVLSAYDDLIENNARSIQILEEMAQALYREWFVHFRFPGHEKSGMVESEMGPIPEGWNATPLGDLCSRITDGSHWSPKTVEAGFPMASVKDMHSWGLDVEGCRKIGEDDYRALVRNDCKPLKNDILVAKDGSYLKHIFVVDEELDVVILSSIALLRPSGKMSPYLLALYLLQPEIKSRLKGYVSGVAIPRIVLKDFRKFLVLQPPLDLQAKLGDLIKPLMGSCYNLTQANINLRKTRDLLLPKLISGVVDIAELEIAGVA
jgi:type I restriction enzyme S subunit